MSDRLLTASVVARLLGCSRWTVYRRIRRGELTATRLRGQRWGAVVVASVEVERFRRAHFVAGRSST